MKRTYLLVGLGLIAAVGLVSTAVAGSHESRAVSVKKKKRAKRGPAGPLGPQGAPGTQGTVLQAALQGDGSPLSFGANSGVAGVSHTPDSGVYVITFNRDVRSCNPQVTLEADGSGSVAARLGTTSSGDAVEIRTGTYVGNPTDNAFFLSVFC